LAFLWIGALNRNGNSFEGIESICGFVKDTDYSGTGATTEITKDFEIVGMDLEIAFKDFATFAADSETTGARFDDNWGRFRAVRHSSG
jgi:hypothetical protein